MFTHFPKLCLLIAFQSTISRSVIPTYQKTETAKTKMVWFSSSYVPNKETLTLLLRFILKTAEGKKIKSPNQNSNSLQINAQYILLVNCT